jgi:putative inorganic carbon (HCO3(-)) transporter
MLSIILDRAFLAFCGLALFTRLLLQPSLNKIESLGQEHIATLLNNLVLFVIAFLFILKKTALGENIRFPKTFWPLALLCLLASISFFYSIDAPSSLLYSFDLWASFFFMLVLVNLLSSMISVEIIVGVLIALVAIASANAVYEYLVILPKVLAQARNGIPAGDRGILQLLNSHRTPTLFEWPNILAGFLVMTLPLTIAFLVSMRSYVIKFLLGIVILVALYALFLTMAVSSWISLLAAAMIYFLMLKRHSFTPQVKTWGILIIFLIVIITTFTVVKKMTLPGLNSITTRQQYLNSSWQLIKLHPFLGSGWRSYGIASIPFTANTNGLSYFTHNSYLQIWTELGIIGLIVFLVFLWMLCKDALALIGQEQEKNLWLVCAVIAGIGGCAVDNLFSYTMLKPQVALFWWVLCALLIVLKENLEPLACLLKKQGVWKILFLIMTLAGGVMTARIAQAEYDFFTAVHDIHSGTQYARAEQLCREAKKLDPWDKKYDLARAYALFCLFNSNPDLHTLQLAREAALSTEGQVSLGFERDTLLNRINDILKNSDRH